MTRKQRRLILIGGSLGVLAIAAALVLSALKDSIVFFNSPTDVVEKHIKPGTRIRLGGLVAAGSVGVLAIAAALVLSALRDSIVFFNSPTDIVDKRPAPGTRMRIGGLVKPGSLARGDNLRVRFEVTDGNKDVAVRYQGIVPDLFREGQGVVAEGALEPDGTFVADTVLAKHDERYMPREVVDALKKSGRWQEGEAK
jgi:cytochrome c-type biogenesis protein CcmE